MCKEPKTIDAKCWNGECDHFACPNLNPDLAEEWEGSEPDDVDDNMHPNYRA